MDLALGRKAELNGVIQLFNCFYIKDPVLESAAKKFPACKFKFDEKQFFRDRPVFFGWGRDKSVQKKGKEIFGDYEINCPDVYNLDYSENKFYHPKGIDRILKDPRRSDEMKAQIQKQLEAFHHWVNEDKTD